MEPSSTVSSPIVTCMGHAHDAVALAELRVTSDPDSTTITYLPIIITTHLDIGFSIHGHAPAALIAQRRPSAKETPPLAHNKGQRLPGKLRANLRFYTVYY